VNDQRDITGGIERPIDVAAAEPAFGSDIVAATLRALGIPYVALNPGSSYRGLHDSLVNFLGNTAPQMLLCLHEEHAVAIAHGYAKVTGRPLAVAVHANVGLMHATMAIFNAWCDRMPVLVLGATGPVDAAKRRPWIDWIHTARDQGALVRPYVKWDDQPTSPAATREALLRALWLACTPPMAPVYINLDAQLQEAPLAEPLAPLDIERFLPDAPAGASPALLRRAAELLRRARRPLFLIGRASRSEDMWKARVRLAELLGAGVLTDLKVGAAFPTDHPLHLAAPSVMLTRDAIAAIAGADVIVSLDWVDLGGTLKKACGDRTPTIIHASLDHTLHHGWSMDYHALPPVDILFATDADVIVLGLIDELTGDSELAHRAPRAPGSRPGAIASTDARLRLDDLALAFREASGDRPVSLSHLPLSWNGGAIAFHHPLDFLGSDGGGGIGAGPGIAVGAALALRESGRLSVAICGDGDYLMGVTALWTAVHYRIPLLVIVANNRSFYNDEVHQARVATMRSRPVANKWIGQRIADPDIDHAALARAQGAAGYGPVTRGDALVAVLLRAMADVDAGRVAVVDVHVEPGEMPGAAAEAKPLAR
jgi:thiamine pyrophosphate-dependent acetolactate synthase large subunit-like protein